MSELGSHFDVDPTQLAAAIDFFSNPYPSPQEIQQVQLLLTQMGNGNVPLSLILRFQDRSFPDRATCFPIMHPQGVTIGDGTIGTENQLFSIFEQYSATESESIHRGTRDVNRMIKHTVLPPEFSESDDPEVEFNLIRGLIAITGIPGVRITNADIAICGVQKQGLALADPEISSAIFDSS